MFQTDVQCRYMVIKCLVEVKEFSEALSMLMNEDLDDKKHTSTSRTFQHSDQDSLQSLFNVPEEECRSVS